MSNQWLLPPPPPKPESKSGSSPFLKLPFPPLFPAAVKNIFRQNADVEGTMRTDVTVVTTISIASYKFVLHGIQRKQ